MRRLLALILVAVLCVGIGSILTSFLAHGGGLDACGGHNDRKHGGYHVHNWSAYCNCHPDAADCARKKGVTTPNSPGSSRLVSPQPGTESLASLNARVQKLEARVDALERALANR